MPTIGGCRNEHSSPVASRISCSLEERSCVLSIAQSRANGEPNGVRFLFFAHAGKNRISVTVCAPFCVSTFQAAAGFAVGHMFNRGKPRMSYLSMIRRKTRRVAALAVLAVVVHIAPAAALTYTVSNTNDSGDGSLRK